MMSTMPTKQAGVVSPVFLGHSLMFLVLLSVLGALQYQYWYGKYGRHNLMVLQDEYELQYQKNLAQQQKIDRLRADVADLKNELLAVEEHARADLGLIKSGEVFVQISNAPVVKLENESKPTVREPDAVEIIDVID